MTSHPKVRRAPAKRLRALFFGSTAAIGSVTIAGGASASVLFLAILGSLLGLNGSLFQWLQPIITAASFSTVGASKPSTPPPTNVTVEEPATTPESNGPAQTSGKREMKLGINILMPAYHGGARAFTNLIVQSPWWLVTSAGGGAMPAERLDENQNIKTLAAGEKAYRMVSAPTKALLGQSVDLVCRWSGKARVNVTGKVAQNLRLSANSLTFTFVPSGTSRPQFYISELDMANPIRDIDCREADANPDAVYDPAFLAELSRYNTIRFIKWQTAVEANTPIRWVDRVRSTSNSYMAASDGVPIEKMVLLANETQSNPWFCMPWNADDEYIRKFAEYVRDHLDPGLVVYVETSNEVWNWMYKVTVQARDEGRARGLAQDDGRVVLYRYAERTGEVMDIWRAAFANNPKRLVRVVSTQNVVPWAAEQVLNYKDTATKVDALSTAPYINWKFAAGETAPANFLTKAMIDEMAVRMGHAATNKKLATEKGLRYITYEAGQHITVAGDAQVPMLLQLQQDPRMGELYTRYLTQWKDEFGDLMVLFAAWGATTKYGAWGMQEYMGQPLNEAPKAQAVDLFARSYLTKH